MHATRRLLSGAVPPSIEPHRSLEVILMVSHHCNVLHEDVAVPQYNADNVGKKTSAEEGHHDRVNEGEVAR